MGGKGERGRGASAVGERGNEVEEAAVEWGIAAGRRQRQGGGDCGGTGRGKVGSLATRPDPVVTSHVRLSHCLIWLVGGQSRPPIADTATRWLYFYFFRKSRPSL